MEGAAQDAWKVPDVVAIISAIAATASACVAAGQIWLSRRDANRRAVLELLRDIDAASRGLLPYSVEDAQACILARYCEATTELTDGAQAYFAFLNSADLAAFATSKGLADQKLVDEYLATLVRKDVVTRTFLLRLQEACGDDKIYEHLYHLLLRFPVRGVPPQ